MKLEWKRLLRSFPGIFLGSLILLSALGGIFYFCQQANIGNQKQKTVSIGIVAREGEPFIDWMIDTLETMENTKYTCKFRRLSESKAEKELAKGEISVIFIIPEKYIASIIDGENKHITIRFSQGQTTIVSFLLRELCTAASSFILDSEAGIYTLQDYYRKNLLENRAEDELELNLDYIREIARLSNGIRTEEVNSRSDYSLTATYAISAVVLFFFLWGMAYGNLLTSQNHAFYNQLKLRGVGYEKQILGRNAAFFLINFLGVLLLLAGGSLILLKLPSTLIPNLLSSAGKLWKTGFLLLPVLWMACCFIQFIYEVTQDALGGILFLMFSVVFMGLLSGCFYPLSYLPSVIQKIAPFLPVYQGCQYGLSVLYDNIQITPLLWTVGYGGFFLCITSFIRHKKY